MGLALASTVAFGQEPPPPAGLDLWPAPGVLTAEARTTFDWVIANGDAEGLPFAIVDKKLARVFLFHADGRLAGDSAALLGLAPGDHGVPGAGQRVANLLPEERTTPSGRFVSQPGHNLQGEAVVWVDYEAAIAIHRVRPGPARERREQRLATSSPVDNRISLGCVVVPVAFYEQVVAPVLGRGRGVVYVLPETHSAAAMLAARSARLQGAR